MNCVFDVFLLSLSRQAFRRSCGWLFLSGSLMMPLFEAGINGYFTFWVAFINGGVITNCLMDSYTIDTYYPLFYGVL